MSAVARWAMRSLCVMFYLVDPHELALGPEDKVPPYFLLSGIPMFFIFIAVERLGIAVRDARSAEKVSGYRWREATVSVLVGTFQQAFLVSVEAVLGLGIEKMAYRYAYDHWRLFEVDGKEYVYFSYVTLLLGKDLGYYWCHRCLHEFHVLWSAHSVHHSGEDYNLAMGLRQGALQPIFGFFFYLPLAILGFNPVQFAAHAQLNTLYMFWIHTELCERLPWGLERILNSASHHRMHHRPPGNCNYAGVFIIWDRMFGTFTPETERKDYYGLAEQPLSYDPLVLNSRHFEVMQRIGGGPTDGCRLVRALRVLKHIHKRRVPWRWSFKPFIWLQPVPPIRADHRRTGPLRQKFDGELSMGTSTSVCFIALTLVGLGGSVALLLLVKSMHMFDALAGVLSSCLLISGVTRLAEQRSSEKQWALAQSVLFAPVLFALLLGRPIERALAA
uniref:Fatty acid hydroxylase domain-containing protein n=1 Tax=Calcidiscus leptoporus TaxID=127549 RepID=A0A7S0IUM6_9EUKA|mmetsp:Transcript_23776/g.55112  ORF Transcript_23776/g.55112 Transcript_23776/m.55112 type:complete len:445 (+) Transcript_23776:50-1384(+)